MAQNVIEFMGKNPNLKVVTFSGNIHSRLTEGFPGNLSHKNMGSEILRLASGKLSLRNSRNILFRYDEGSAWQCVFDKDKKIVCGDRAFGPADTVYATATNLDRYYLREPEITDGHFESIFIRRVGKVMIAKNSNIDGKRNLSSSISIATIFKRTMTCSFPRRLS
jgi:hypothetical protein